MMVLFFLFTLTQLLQTHFPLLEIHSLAIGDRNQLKSLHVSGSSQTAHPYKALLPCLSFHLFSCCCPPSSQPVLYCFIIALQGLQFAPGEIINNHGSCQHYLFYLCIEDIEHFPWNSQPLHYCDPGASQLSFVT